MVAGTNAQRRSIRGWRCRIAALLLLTAALLTGCGVLESTLVLNPDGSGVRTITATFSPEDVTGDAVDPAVIESTIAASIPDAMHYDGYVTTPEGGLVFTFTIAFTSVQDYRDAVVEILAAGGEVSSDVQISIEQADSVFRHGTTITENIEQVQLLRWLDLALIDADLLPDGSGGIFVANGDSFVVVDGERHQTSVPIDFSSMQEFGLQALTVTTVHRTDGGFDRRIEYDLSEVTYQTNPDGYDVSSLRPPPTAPRWRFPDRMRLCGP